MSPGRPGDVRSPRSRTPGRSSSSSGTVTVDDHARRRPAASTSPPSGTGWTVRRRSGRPSPARAADALAPQLSYPADHDQRRRCSPSGPATLDNNTATVTNAGDTNAANNTATDSIGVRCADARAPAAASRPCAAAGACACCWRTSYEVDNLGFRVYRETAGVRTLVTPSLVAGSALSSASRAPLGRAAATPGSTTRRSSPAPSTGSRTSTSTGRSGWTGPVTPATPPTGRRLRRRRRAGLPLARARQLAATAATAAAPASRPRHRARATARGGPRRRSSGRAAPRRTARSGPAAKLLVAARGLVPRHEDQLLAAGFDPGSDPRGAPAPRRTARAGDPRRRRRRRPLRRADAIEFYGLGLDSPCDGEHVYWLVAGGEPGLARRARRPPGRSRPAAGARPASRSRSSGRTAPSLLRPHRERRRRELLRRAGDRRRRSTLTLDAPHLDTTAAGSASLTIALQGVTRGVAHVVDVQLNGHDAGTLSFAGQDART